MNLRNVHYSRESLQIPGIIFMHIYIAFPLWIYTNKRITKKIEMRKKFKLIFCT